MLRCVPSLTRSARKGASYRAREGLEPQLIRERDWSIWASSNTLGCASFGLARGSQAGSARGGMPCMPKRHASEHTAPIRETQTRCGNHQPGGDVLARVSSRITDDNRATPHCSWPARECDTRHLRADSTNRWEVLLRRLDARQIPERRSRCRRPRRAAYRELTMEWVVVIAHEGAPHSRGSGADAGPLSQDWSC
jgi:hypothetical protein